MTRTLLTLTLTLAPGLALAQQPTADAKVYELRTYYAASGKLDDLHARFRAHTVRLYERHGITSVGYWVPADNRENKLVCLVSHPSEAARRSAWSRLAADPEWARAMRLSERDGKLVDAIADKLLTPAEVTALTAQAPDGEPRVFELRTYTTDRGRLSELTAEVRADGKRMSERTGVTPVASWTPKAGERGADTTVVSLVAYNPVAGRDRSLISTRSTPKPAPVGIVLVGGVEAKEPREPEQSVVLVPTDYSPLK